MASSRADTRRPFGARPGAPADAPTTPLGAPFGPTLVLSVLAAVAVFALVTAVVLLIAPQDPSTFDGPGGEVLTLDLGDRQNQSAKSLLYIFSFTVVPLLGLWAGARAADAVAAGPNRRALGALAAVLTGGLAVLLLFTRVSSSLPWGDGLGVILVLTAGWALAGAWALRRAARGGEWPRLLALAQRTDVLAGGAGALVLATLLCFSTLSLGRLAVVVVGVGAIASVLALVGHRRPAKLRGPGGAVLDAIALVVVLLAVPDVVIFTSSLGPVNVYFPPGVIQFHHDLVLGPTNQLLAGGALLVDVPVSQYGVGAVYFLAAWFHVAPIGYSTYGLMDGILTALFFGAGYGVLRVGGVSRLLAIPTLALATFVLIYNLEFNVGSLPQQGPFRFGLPMALVLLTVIAERMGSRARVARGLAFVFLGISAIWAFEAFAYTSVTFVALLALRMGLRPAGERRAFLVREFLLGAGAVVLAHVLFALVTLIGTGELPDWNQYLAYMKVFLLGGRAGEITYGFAHWTPALAIGTGYAASAIGLVLLLRRAPALASRHRAALVAIAGTTAHGIMLFSYTQNRSSTYLLCYVGLPAILTGVLWLGVLLRSVDVAPVRVRVAGTAFLLSVGFVLLVAAEPEDGRFSRTALAHAYPGGGLPSALERLWDTPTIDPRAADGVALLQREMPGDRAMVLLPRSPDLAMEILMRANVGNALPISNSIEDSFVPDVRVPPLEKAIAELRPGARVLVNDGTFRALADLATRPAGFDPLDEPESGGDDPLTDWVLQRISQRFSFERAAGGPRGFAVAQLVPKS